MINKIIAFSIRNKSVIGFFIIALVAWGIYSLTKLPIDAVPDITNNQVQVITVSPTLAALEVEQFVTAPIERSMATLPDRLEIRSISRFGLSLVTIVFKDDVNIYFARQLVNERLKEAEGEIPPGAGSPELGPVSTGLGEIYQYILRPDSGYENKYNASDLRTIQDWIVARRLLGTPGIAEVNSFGGKLKQYEVAVDPIKLKSMDVTIPEVFEALEKNNENTGGAYIDKKPNVYYIRGIGLVSSLEDISKIVVKTNQNGTPTKIGDVAIVQLGSAIRYGAMTRNGEGEVVGGVVMMLKGSNSAEVVAAVKEKIPAIQKSLPEGVKIEPYLDRTALVNKSIETVQHNLLVGALIVIFVLVLFLGNLRAGLIVASLIPLSMLFAFILMNLFGVSGNLMSLGAIDFGLIVDGAVIIVEAILHRIHQSHHHKGKLVLDTGEMNDEVYAASSGVAGSSAFGQMIILIVYIPILTLIGIEGKMFRPMAMTVSFAIIGALILSLTYVPMMSALLLSRKTTHKINFSDRLMNLFQRIYNPVINFAIKRKAIVIGISVLLFAGSVLIFSRLGGEFIPTLEEGDFTFSCVLPQGSSLSQSIDNVLKVENILKKFPEVKQVIGKTGTAEIPTDPEPVEASDVTAVLKDQSEWTTAHSREALQDTMIKALQVIPGVFFEASQPIQMRFNELMTGVKQDIAVKIFGENIDSLAFYADKTAKVIASVEGAGTPKVEKVGGLPQITIVYNRDRMSQYSLNIKDLNRIVRTAFAGEVAGLVFENERRFDLVVRLGESQRQDIDDVRNLYIPLAGGGQIPLQQVANIDFVNGPAQVSREDAKRRIVLGINVRGRDVKSVVDEIAQKLDKQVKLPAGYYYTFGGQFENLVQATSRLQIAVPIALLLIFVLLYLAFRSAKQALLIYSGIPFSAIGGILALWIRGMNFSISAGVGFIALFGVAVLFGIVLVNYFNRLEADGIEDVKERVIMGTKAILRPVLMASFLAAFGFLPMALATSQGAEVQRPLATVVIGGIFSASALTLIVLPALYILFSGKRKSNKTSTMTKTAPIILLFFALASSPLAQAQTTSLEQPAVISLDSAIIIAMKNNPVLQSAQLSVVQQQKLRKTAWDFGKTGVFYENEDLIKNESNNNGVLKIGITQTIDFPTTYFAQNNLNKQNETLSQTSFTLAQKEMLRDVRSAYFNLWFAVEKQKLLLQQDSIFTDFENAAELRYKSGETNKLELISAKSKHQEIQLTMEASKADIVIAQQEIVKLLNITQPMLPDNAAMVKLQSPVSASQSPFSGHPLLNLYQQRISLAEYQRKVETNKMLPDFSVRYFNQNWYGRSPGYYGYSFSVGIPLFFWGNQGRIQGAKIQQQIAQKDLETVTLQFSTGYNQALKELNKQQALLSYYESTGMQYANEILNSAQLAFKNGEIGYIEYITLLSQSIDIKNNYLSALTNYNQAIIQLNFFINQ